MRTCKKVGEWGFRVDFNSNPHKTKGADQLSLVALFIVSQVQSRDKLNTYSTHGTNIEFENKPHYTKTTVLHVL